MDRILNAIYERKNISKATGHRTPPKITQREILQKYRVLARQKTSEYTVKKLKNKSLNFESVFGHSVEETGFDWVSDAYRVEYSKLFMLIVYL
jgi:hypothetical protein